MYGKRHTQETKDKISKANKGKLIGSNNPNAKIFRMTSPDGIIFILKGTLKKFCKLKGFSYATARKLIQQQCTATRGSLKNWYICQIKEEELMHLDNYIFIDNTFEGFKL